MKSIRSSFACVGVALGLAAGCSSPASEPSGTSSSKISSGIDERGTITYLDQRPDEVLYFKHLERHFTDDVWKSLCGSGFDLDITFHFGAVTDTSIEVKSLEFRYHPLDDGTVFMTSSYLWSNDTHAVSLSPYQGFREGDVYAVDINKTFTVSASSALVLDTSNGSTATSIGPDLTDVASGCVDTGELIFLPRT